MKQQKMNLLIISLPLFIFNLVACKPVAVEYNLQTYDSHVHIMSPELISSWKDLGIPFSKPEAYYSNIDTILNKNNADYIDLIGMGYVYGNSEFYKGNDIYQKIKQENDYLLNEANKYPNKVKPFFAVDPLKDFAIDEINRCSKINPKSGLKLHFSSSQVYLTESEHIKKIKPIFRLAADKGLPVLLHFDNWHPKFGRPDVKIFVDSILQEIPPITLRIAHFGTSGGFNQKTKNVLDAFSEFFEENKTPKKHKVLFDISAVALDKNSEGVEKLTNAEFKELKNYIDKLGIDNIIFGTDYPLYSTKEYINILKNKLGFTEPEIKIIMNEKI